MEFKPKSPGHFKEGMIFYSVMMFCCGVSEQVF